MEEKRKPLDLRKPKAPPPPAPPQPPAAAPPPAVPGPASWRPLAGFLPPGEPIRLENLTPMERANFEKLGVTEGTVVPGNLGDIMAEIRSESDPDHVDLPLPADFRLAEPRVIDAGTMTPEQQARVRGIIAEAGEKARQIADIPVIPGAAPGVNEAIARAEMDRINARTDRGDAARVSVVDDRITRNPAAQPQVTVRAGTIPTGGVYVHKGRVDELPAEAARRVAGPGAADGPPEPPPGEMTATGAGDARHCPHCGWDLSNPSMTALTDADKYGFLWSVLGGPDKRFTRQFELMGGRMVLNFRTLTSREADLALSQVAADVRAGDIPGDITWMQRWLDYRLAFALESIVVDGLGKTYVGPSSIDEIEYDAPVDADGNGLPGTPFPALWAHVQEQHLYNESLRRTVCFAYASFVDMVKKMEANYENRDFWRGIGGPA
jgi:hypothetical protein